MASGVMGWPAFEVASSVLVVSMFDFPSATCVSTALLLHQRMPPTPPTASRSRKKSAPPTAMYLRPCCFFAAATFSLIIRMTVFLPGPLGPGLVWNDGAAVGPGPAPRVGGPEDIGACIVGGMPAVRVAFVALAGRGSMSKRNSWAPGPRCTTAP